MIADVEFIGSFVVNQVENDIPQFRLNAPRRIVVSEETDLSVMPSFLSEAKKCGFTLRRFFHSKIFCSQRRLSVRVINANLEDNPFSSLSLFQT